MSTTAISIRLDSEIKEQFEKLCKEFGLSTNAAINLFARTVVREKAIPFPISLSTRDNRVQARSESAQQALNESQYLSSKESHRWTDEEIDELIASVRRIKSPK